MVFRHGNAVFRCARSFLFGSCSQAFCPSRYTLGFAHDYKPVWDAIAPLPIAVPCLRIPNLGNSVVTFKTAPPFKGAKIAPKRVGP